MDRIKKCKQFKDLLQNQFLALPGAYNGITGRLVAQTGYLGCYISGAAVTASYGVTDIGLLTLDHFSNKIKEVSLASGLPIIADADTGFGEVEMCYRTVFEYFNSGACGLHIEDQVFPKRCGHLDGRTLISQEAMVDKVKICVEASKKLTNNNFIICARTDAAGVYNIDEAIKRSKAYIDAGAHMIFPEGLNTKEDFYQVSKSLKSYNSNIMLLANMTEFGKTPYITEKEFKQMGYNCVIYPVSTLRIANKAIKEFLIELKNQGTQKELLNKMQTRQELYDILEYKPGIEWKFPKPTNKDQLNLLINMQLVFWKQQNNIISNKYIHI